MRHEGGGRGFERAGGGEVLRRRVKSNLFSKPTGKGGVQNTVNNLNRLVEEKNYPLPTFLLISVKF